MYAAAAQAGIGLIQTVISAAKASKLPDPKKHEVGSEMRLAYNMSRRRAEEGYSPEEKAQFEQMLARQGTAAKSMMQNVGLSGSASAAASIMGTDAMNQFAAKGADIKRQNFGQFAGLAGQIQGVQDMEVGRFNQQLNMESQALGQAASSGIGNMFGGLNAAQNFGQQNKAIDAWNNMGQDGTGAGVNKAVNPNVAPSMVAQNQQAANMAQYQNQMNMSGFPANTFQSQGTPFLPLQQQQQLQQEAQTPFGSAGFGMNQQTDWNALWGG